MKKGSLHCLGENEVQARPCFAITDKSATETFRSAVLHADGEGRVYVFTIGQAITCWGVA